MAAHGFVYVARARATGHVKIGFSTQPVHRVQQLAANTRQILDLVAIMRGTRQDEAALLQRMDAHRVQFFGCREWLGPCSEVDAFVASLGSHRIGPMPLGRGVVSSLRVGFWAMFHRYTREIEAHCDRLDASPEAA